MIFTLVMLFTLMFHHVVIGSVLVAVLSALSWLMKPSPELKCILWTTAFVVATVIPLFLIQTDELALTAEMANQSAVGTQLNTGSINRATVPDALQNANPTFHVPAFYIYQYAEVLFVFIGLWTIGSLLRSYRIARAWWQTRALLESANHFDTRLSIPISTLITPLAQSPMVIGLLKPAIVLPTSIVNKLTTNQLEPILLHELAHIQRKDLWVSIFQELLAILFWWSPVMRFINAKIHINREMSCDLRAMRTMKSAKHYAQSLIDCTRLMLKQHQNILAMSLFSKKKDLVYRIDEVLNPKRKQSPTSWKLIGVGVLFGISSLALANQLTPSINVSAVSSQAKQFEHLPERVSEQIVDAIRRQDRETLQVLFNDGIDINVPVYGEGTALMIAIKENKTNLANWLLDNGADPNQASLIDGNPLIVASKQNNVDMVSTLIALGADVNANVLYDETPLINASRFASLQTVKLLVENGADVNFGVVASTVNGDIYRSPLNVAKNAGIRNYLIAQGAN